MSVWVVNTSPLVFLGNLGRLELPWCLCLPLSSVRHAHEKR